MRIAFAITAAATCLVPFTLALSHEDPLKGYARRLFQARAVEEHLEGKPYRAEKELGWKWKVDLTDALMILNYLFLSGAPIPDPGAESCGPAPTDHQLPECTYSC